MLPDIAIEQNDYNSNDWIVIGNIYGGTHTCFDQPLQRSKQNTCNKTTTVRRTKGYPTLDKVIYEINLADVECQGSRQKMKETPVRVRFLLMFEKQDDLWIFNMLVKET